MKDRDLTFAVFGLGSFGGSLVKELAEMKQEILAVDLNPERVDYYSQYATQAVVASGYDEKTLRAFGVRNIDHAFVSFGEDIQASVLTTMVLKELGVPKVWAKAHDENHGKILEKIGADRVIHPERDMAKRITHNLHSSKIIDFIELSNSFSIAEIKVTERSIGKKLSELDLQKRFNVNLVAIQRGQQTILSFTEDEEVQRGDLIVVIGNNDDIENFDEGGS
ncbi:trk system potassium uptake protein TrkA [Chryseomicrobium aureum]|uniref:potassium channel family protein n=1 Tax=Chryseomicrobium aureum TaxID=1441723 RepID=UPI00195EC1E1|nr:TrkA family potassium uptake protein [Chryseomicrobium aureum]MBM7705799.1 trk system potassium uptake protein TrkA [Chryseomicrobium aureum]